MRPRVGLTAFSFCGVTHATASLTVCIRPRGRHEIETRTLAAAVDFTGISGDIAKLNLPAQLAERGLLRADPPGLGLDVDDAFDVG